MRTMFVASVEVATRHYSEDAEVLAPLADYSPVLGSSPRGWVQVQMHVSATGLTHACTKAAAIAHAATGFDAISCHVMTEEEYADRDAEQPGSAFGVTPSSIPERVSMVLPVAGTRTERAAPGA